MSNPNLEPIKAWRPEDLNERQDIITKLYWDENQDLPKVMEMMELQYRFKASERQYKTAFKRWGLQKNVTGADMKHLVRIRNCRFAKEGKATEFYIHKRRVSDAKIERWEQRTGFGARVTMSGPSRKPRTPSTPQTPSKIEYKTPEKQILVPEMPRSPARRTVTRRTSSQAGELKPEDANDFTTAILTTPTTLYLSPGYDLSQWFALHGMTFSPRVIAEIERKARRK